MTIDAAIPLAVYTVAGAGPYPAGWPYAAGTLRAQVLTDAGWQDLAPADFTPAPEASATTGAVTLAAAVAAEHAGRRLMLSRATPREQGWEGLAGTRELGLETALDQVTQALQEVAAQADRALRLDSAIPPTALDEGAAVMWDGTRFVSGPDAAAIAAAGTRAAEAAEAADRAEAAAAAITSFADRLRWSGTVTWANQGKGPYALPADPGRVNFIDLTMNRVPLEPVEDFLLVDMPSAASGKGIEFVEPQIEGHVFRYRFVLPQMPLPTDLFQYPTLEDFDAAVTGGLTVTPGRTITAGGMAYVAEPGAALAGIPAGFRPVQWVWTREELEAATWTIAPGQNVIFVLDGDDVVPFVRTALATGLVGGDNSRWRKAGISSTDMIAIANDIASAMAMEVTNADIFAACTGTANAIILTTGKPYGVVPTGARIRFRASAANTGAVTIAVDGLPAVAAKLTTGADLPAGHIRTDVEMVATFDGTFWVVTRQISRGGTLTAAPVFSTPGGSSFGTPTTAGWWRREGNVVTFYVSLIIAAITKSAASGNFNMELTWLDEAGNPVTIQPIGGTWPVLIGNLGNYPAPASAYGPAGEFVPGFYNRIRLGYVTVSGTPSQMNRTYFSASHFTDGQALTCTASGSFVVAP